jgi:hypothetical protein
METVMEFPVKVNRPPAKIGTDYVQ